jgi:hypothetical protein
MTEILECADCACNFCTVCDDEWRKCPDCGEALCGECAELSLDMRMTRCLTCFDEDLTGDNFDYGSRKEEFGRTHRELYRKYTRPVTGTLRD